LSRRTTRGTVYGVDQSGVMLRQATRRNAAAVRAGRVRLVRATVERLPEIGEPLDAVLAVNSLGFWTDPALRLGDLHARLRPGGRIAVASQPRCPGATAATTAQAAAEIENLLRQAGFSRMRTETLDLTPPVACVLGCRD
jgi:SAM-dependent methyltransferase